MNILIAGATGLIGKTLIPNLLEKHHIIALGREIKTLEKSFKNSAVAKITWDTLESLNAQSIDLVINLAGSNIGAHRWNPKLKKELIDSRVQSNQKLIQWIIQQNAKPRYFSASAIGIYGAHPGDREIFFDEESAIQATENDFLKEIGIPWEQSALPAIDHDLSVCLLRFGVVLKKNEGMLKPLERPFRLGLGCILGNGSQMISWIHHEDLARAILFLVNRPDIQGPINITAPHPISQKTFASFFANTLKRPLFLTMPEIFVKFLFGEMGDYLLLKGQAVLPKRLTQLGFKFTYPSIQQALEKEYSGAN